MPLHWSEVDDKKLHPQKWSIKTAVPRIEDEPDPWEGWRRRARSLKTPRKSLDGLLAEIGAK